jgi:hypothetical protein
MVAERGRSIILESITAFAMKLPRKQNLRHDPGNLHNFGALGEGMRPVREI